MIAVIDYGMGNLRSVQKALQTVGAKVKITSDPKDLERSDKLVFPGVGAFGEAMTELKKLGLIAPIKDAVSEGKFFLGLCLGLQLLFEKSEEAPGVKGLALIKGEVKKFRPADHALKVPHMGWNNIMFAGKTDPVLKGIRSSSYVYFVHSYYVKPKDPKIALTTTEYCTKFVSGIRKGNIYGFQFHPEKSQELGLKILDNFVKLK